MILEIIFFVIGEYLIFSFNWIIGFCIGITGVVLAIIIDKLPPNYFLDLYQNKTEFFVFLKKTVNWLIFVAILYIIIRILVLIGFIYFPESIEYFQFFQILVLFFLITMIISYCPAFDLLKKGIYKSKVIYLLIVLIIASSVFIVLVFYI